MEARQVAIVTVLAVLGVVAGYLVGRGQGSGGVPDDPEAAVAEWEPGESKAGKAGRRRGARRERPADEDRPRVQAMRRELDRKDAQLAGYQMRLGAGGWKDVAERDAAAEHWYSTVEALEAACSVNFDLVALECGDTPCAAILRERETPLVDALGACEPWTRLQGALRSAPVDCGDGRTETAVFAAPGPVADERAQALAAGFRCTPPPLKPATP